MVEPPPSRAPRWAAASMPRAPPLTVATPARARVRAREAATSRPIGEALLAPTMATRGASGSSGPTTNSPAGGSRRSMSGGGYPGSWTATSLAPAAPTRSATSPGSMTAA